MANANGNAAAKPLRLLCFDGGTPSGAFSQLGILNSLLSQASTAGDGKSKADQEFYPHTHFDMIAGTGLGGLLALMFGALQMSISEAEDRLETLCSGVFTSEHTVSSNGNVTRGIFQRARNLLWQNDGSIIGGNRLVVEQEPLFNLSLLKKEVQLIVNEAKVKVHGMESIDPTQPNTCLAFVCVRNTFNMANCEHLRTYIPKDRHPTDYSIVEAACATITTPGLFDARVQMPNGPTLVGAGVGTNNPTRELLQEAERVYGTDRQVGCLISIGSGVLSPLSIKRVSSEGIGGVMVRVAADCEGVARTLRDNLREVGIYFRFSVDRGMGETTMLGWQQDDGSMTHTDTYLGDTEQYLTLCAKRMKKLDVSFRLRMLNQATAIGITPKSPPPNSPYFTPRDRLLRHMEDTLLRPTQPTLNRKRILVISGNEGSGKTQIVSHFSRLHREE
ncbi:hypothetical protein FRC15_004191 [Serendipita sp. 397]|nr:hypothetical protein FRC16_006925 [Serendipita sp. 398]KAG8770202.1 hypothetical protein FRC15_004191 [Serendipita sp. 397]